jgi:hypothetical protein
MPEQLLNALAVQVCLCLDYSRAKKIGFPIIGCSMLQPIGAAM